MGSLITISALKTILKNFENTIAYEDKEVKNKYEENIGGKAISITINNTLNNNKIIKEEIDTFVLTDIPETGYTLQGYATEVDGSVVYNIGDKLTENTELWTVYQKYVGYLYNSENDPNYDPADMNSPYWNGVNVLHFDNIIEAVCPTENITQTITFTVETDAELKNTSGGYWLNGYCTSEFSSDYGEYVPGAEQCYITEIEDGVYEISWTLYWNYIWEAFTPGESYPIAGFGNAHYSSGYFSVFSDICTTNNLGTYFKVRDDYRIENN